jgi:hypothetical protein
MYCYSSIIYNNPYINLISLGGHLLESSRPVETNSPFHRVAVMTDQHDASIRDCWAPLNLERMIAAWESIAEWNPLKAIPRRARVLDGGAADGGGLLRSTRAGHQCRSVAQDADGRSPKHYCRAMNRLIIT